MKSTDLSPIHLTHSQHITSTILLLLICLGAFSQPKALHVDGRHLKDSDGQVVVLHGFGQTYSPWFNEQGSKWTNYDVYGCLNYNKGLINDILAAGWKMDFVRLHMDPYWSNTPGVWTSGESDIHAFSMERFKLYLDQVFIPMAEFIISKGMYVIMRPPGVCPEEISVGDAYQQYLIQVWDYVSNQPRLKNNPGVLYELANEPVRITKNGQVAGTEELVNFFQPIVDIMRSHCDNILLIPGLGYQSQYAGFAAHPVEGTNIGYAMHCYPGWYNGGHGDNNVIVNYSDFKQGWDEQITPCSNFAPMVVTEMDWAPNKYNASWGKSYTGTAGGQGFGANFKKLCDESGNISWMLFTGPEWLAQFKDETPDNGQYTFLTDPEACPWPVYHWYEEYAQQRNDPSHTQVTAVEMPQSHYSLLQGATTATKLIATFADGHQENVAGDALYQVSDAAVAAVKSGNIFAHSEGEVSVSVSYTSPGGQVYPFSMTVSVMPLFPLTNEGFNPSIFETGTFNESTGTLHTGQWGFGGWQYPNGLDLSDYHYLVVRLSQPQYCGTSFRLFDINSYWSDPFMADFGSNTELVIDLQNMVNDKGRLLDPSHLYIIGFWTTGASSVSIKEVFLSNDGITPSGIEAVESTPLGEAPLFDLSGRRVSGRPQSGIYIQKGKKIFIK